MDTVLENRPELYTQLGNPETREKATIELDKIINQLINQTRNIASPGIGGIQKAAKDSGEAIGTVGGVPGTVREDN